MRIIVGLGNPGERYKLTRHNMGFLVIDSVLSIVQGSRFKVRGEFKAEVVVVSEFGEIREKIILVKPMTFMNKSGEAVRKVVDYYSTSGDPLHETPDVTGVGDRLFVIHDELDLPLGRLKIQQNGGAAGHHGVESVIKHLGTQDFVRFRVGIKATLSNSLKASLSNADEDYLLSDFTKKEMEVMLPTIEKTAEAILYALENGVEKAMNKYN